jgi:hypothetical protein
MFYYISSLIVDVGESQYLFIDRLDLQLQILDELADSALVGPDLLDRLLEIFVTEPQI